MILSACRSLIRRMGFDVVRYGKRRRDWPVDFLPYHKEIMAEIRPYSMTTDERQFALIEAVRYIVANRVRGDFVECGVFKGGSSMAMALTLIREKDTSRELYLFDTFEGMPKPGEKDIDCYGYSSAEVFERVRTSDAGSTWMNASLDAVRANMHRTGYPKEKMHFVKGLVEATIPAEAPREIALLRLDTDFYSSTKHELEHLYPRVTPGGVILVDDYGHFKGAREAVDEYFRARQMFPLLHRLDYTGRLIVKPE